MNPVVEHLQQNMVFYIIGGIAGIVGIYVTQRHSLPIIFHCVEMAFYCVLLHSCLHIAVAFASWFQAEAFVDINMPVRELEALIEERGPGLVTPLVKVWVRGDYNPDWLFFLEMGAFCLIIMGVTLFRPIDFGKKREAPPKPGERPGAAGRQQRPAGRAQQRRK